ncbi:hypothetical protein VF21_06137 [Pseudogymnoascus sp. 05NY08]|nr:hypothetical protein VF21_06137 [Pseudogymnoascus sp. 05NY08]
MMGSLRAAQENQLVSKIDSLVSLLTFVPESSPATALPNSNRFSNLDTLVEAVTNQISAGNSRSPPLQHAYPSRELSSPSPLALPSGSSARASSHPSLWSRTVLSPALELSPVDAAISNSPCFSGFQPSPSEAEEYFQLFRTQSLPYLPFIHIPQCTSAQEFQQEKPFLFKVIMAIASPSTSQKLSLGTEIRDALARRIIVENEDSVDVLLGLLAFVTWGHDQFMAPLNLSRFTQLAMSLVFDLRLNKPLPIDLYMISAIDTGASDPSPRLQPTRSLDERRAVLACFLLSSNVSLYFGKIDALRWTAYMDECLQVLTGSQDYPGDEILVTQVRLQLLTDIVTRAAEGVSYGGQSSQRSGTPSLYLKALHSDLATIKRSIPPNLQQNGLSPGLKFSSLGLMS